MLNVLRVVFNALIKTVLNSISTMLPTNVFQNAPKTLLLGMTKVIHVHAISRTESSGKQTSHKVDASTTTLTRLCRIPAKVSIKTCVRTNHVAVIRE